MKLSSLPGRSLLALALSLAPWSASLAQDTTPPVVAKAITDVNVSLGSAPTVVNLKKIFGLQGVTGEVVRFTTTLGNMDVELDAADYPLNVANFLAYVNAGTYNHTFFHRGVSGFIIQGGGYYVKKDLKYPHIKTLGAVAGEHKDSNLRGTIAIALSGGTDSANTGTSEWFFNLADNTNLDTYNSSQGPFTAFGRVIEDGFTTMDAIGAVPTYNASSVVKSKKTANAFTDLPLYNYDDSEGPEITSNLVYLTQVSVIPLTPKAQGDPALLSLSATSSDGKIAKVSINGRKLTLTYRGKPGTATITVTATDAAGSSVQAAFEATVQ